MLITRWLLLLALAGAAFAEEGSRRIFAPVAAGKIFAFPQDHGSHPELALEWWYVTGYLDDDTGERTGFQYTFFRSGIPGRELAEVKSAWAMDEVYLAHFALSRKGRGLAHDSRISRPGPSRAVVGDLDVALEDWRLKREPGTGLELFRLEAASDIGVIDLTLKAVKPPVVHGHDGRYLKGSDGKLSSHYVSIPRMEATGTLEMDGKPRTVHGAAWFDHEFFTLDAPANVGWDWMGLHLDDGSELMLYRFRPELAAPGAPPTPGTGGGTYVDPEGKTHEIAYGDATFEPRSSWKSPRSGAVYPVALRVTVPSRGIALDLAPHQEDQELRTTAGIEVTYWEGLVEGRGERDGRPVAARGYLELTGYAGKAPLARGE